MKKIGIIAALACAFALCLMLVGCGGGGKASKDAFLGDWTISAIESEDPSSAVSSEDIALMQSMGMNVTITFNEDNTFKLDLFGEILNGVWEPKTDTTAVANLDNQDVNVEIDDSGNLIFSQGNDKLIFTKGAAAPAASTDSSATDATATEDAATGDAAADAAAADAAQGAEDAEADAGAATDGAEADTTAPDAA
jgi:hypothetical protein